MMNSAPPPLEIPTTQSSLSCICSLAPSSPSSSQNHVNSASNSHDDHTDMSPVWYCTFSPNGQLIASCHGIPDVCIRIWKLEQNQNNTPTTNTTTNKHSKQYHPDDIKWSLSAVLTGCHERTIRHLAFAPSNTILASASFDGTVGIWEDLGYDTDINSSNNSTTTSSMMSSSWECTAQLEGHESEVKCVAWNASGTLLATCGRDKSVWIWECLLSMDADVYAGDSGGGFVSSAASTPSSAGNAGGDGEFECLAVLHGHSGDVKYVLFVPSNGQWGDGEEILLSASYDDTIKCWAEDAGDWYCAASLSAHSSTVWSIASTLEGTRLISASEDCSLAIWKCYTSTEKQHLISGRENIVHNSTSDGFWKCVGKLDSAHQFSIYHVDCAPSCTGHGAFASASQDTCIQIYREINTPGNNAFNNISLPSSSDAPLFTLDATMAKAHGERDVNCVKWHPKDAHLLVSAGDDGIIKIWYYSYAKK